MAGVYFYAPKRDIKDIVDCGLKLSEWFDRDIFVPVMHGTRRALKTLLNPKDDEKSINDTELQCIRLDIDPDYCVVGDSNIYKISSQEPDLMGYYKACLTPLSDYRFGTFRNPEALVFTSVLPEKIEVMGKILDTPILYESSSELYLKNILNEHEESWKDSGNHLLYAFYVYLESRGRATRLVDQEHGKTIFFYNDRKEYIVLQSPKEVND